MSLEFNTDNKINSLAPKKNIGVTQAVGIPSSEPCSTSSLITSEESLAIASSRMFKFNFANKANRNFLKNEIANLRDSKNELVFSLMDADEIITSKDDYEELYNILNLLKTNNIKLSKDKYERWLADERFSSEFLAEKINILKEFRTSSLFSKIREQYSDGSIMSASLDFMWDNSLEQIQKNVEMLDILKNTRPELYNNLVQECDFFDLRFVFDNKFDKESLTKALNSGYINDKLPYSSMLSFLKESVSTEQLEKNIEILNYIKNNSKVDFLFERPPYGLYPQEYTEMLTREIPLDFDISKKQGVIDFLSEMYSDAQTKNTFFASDRLYLLLKDCDDTYQDGKKAIEFAKNNNIDLSVLRNLLKSLSFNDCIQILESVENPDKFFKEFSSVSNVLQKQNFQKLNNFIKVLNYVMSKESLKDINSRIYWSFESYTKTDDKNILNDLEKCYEIIDKIENFKSIIPNQYICPVLSSLINDEKFDIKQENLSYLNELLNDENLSEMVSSTADTIIFKFLTKDRDIEKLRANKMLLKDYRKENPNDDSFITSPKLLSFEGNVKDLIAKYKELKESNNVYFEINGDNQNVEFHCYQDNGEKLLIYDKNMKLLSEQIMKKTGDDKLEAIVFDKVHNSEHKIITKAEGANDLFSLAEKIISRYFDDKGRVVKMKCYNESCFDGAVNIKEQSPNEPVKNLAKTRETQQGTFTEKELTSCDGTKTLIKSHVGVNGNESYTYRIVDKEGNELLNHNRWRKVVDDNTILYGVNGKEYKAEFSDSSITVVNISNGDETVIDLNKLCPTNKKKHTIKMLKSVPADELLKINKYIKTLDWTRADDSYFSHVDKSITTGSNNFIFGHEFGHAKDFSLTYTCKTEIPVGVISGDKKLQEIYLKELDNLKKNEPDCIREVINYFTAGGEEHYGGEFGGLAEIVAETNALQATAQSHPMLQMRTQILQEYFPRTIAYLIKNHLAV